MLSIGQVETISKNTKTYKITYTYVITIIETGEFEIESETAVNKTR